MKKVFIILLFIMMSMKMFGQELKEFTRYYNHVTELTYDAGNKKWVFFREYKDFNKIIFNIEGSDNAVIRSGDAEPFYMYEVYSAPEEEQEAEGAVKFYYKTSRGREYIGFLSDEFCLIMVGNSAFRFEH